MIDELKNQPEISFIDNLTLEDVLNILLSNFETEYENITGEKAVFNSADTERMVLNSCALLFYQMLKYIDRTGKSNLLGYSYGDDLSRLAATRGLERKNAECSQVKLRFSLSSERNEVVGVSIGTRATDGNGHYFATVEYAEIASGSLFVDVDAKAVDAGTNSNGLPAGTINIIVDPLPYVQSVVNISESKGGTDIESDEELTRRTFLFPGQYSTGGTAPAYEYYALAFRSDIMDVKAFKSNDGEITILFLLSDGSIPDESDVIAMHEYLTETANIKLLTDSIVVTVPTEINYDLELKYYINKSDSNNAARIQNAVNAAVEDYLVWQRHIGRDINPSELMGRIQKAGAKRAEITSPVFQIVDEQSVSSLQSITVLYGGLEDD